MSEIICSKEIFSSWPTSAFVVGVNIGSASLQDSSKPPGSVIPQTLLFFPYSFHPEPERYPRTMHSTGNGLVFFDPHRPVA